MTCNSKSHSEVTNMGSFDKNICLKLYVFFIGALIITPGFAIRTYEEENPDLSQRLEECHIKVTNRCAIEISNSVYNNKTPSEYCCQKHIATGKACHEDFIRLFISIVPKDKLAFVGANGDKIWNQCYAIVASAPAASIFSILP
ncbi:hypothetical protein SADUNF_Sadunf04G0077000 [Salix dunnii]|uniref:Prolamin-like domain-containing protein n=1 Tax=Salix dunnii TaxID=1413687 RepID=A0A835K4F9_9ROSI|nr:hypothetical protein SADUNF_Sadunf04G0077000 [Salix dunnii]